MGILDERAGLAGKIAATIGGGGIGRPTTRVPAEAGVHIALCDIHWQAVESARSDLEALGATYIVALARSVTDTRQHVDGGTMAVAGFLDPPLGDGHLPVPFAETLGGVFLLTPEGEL